MNAWLRNLQYKKLGRRWQTARRICAIFNSVDDLIKHVLPHTDFGRSKSHHAGNTIGSHEKFEAPRHRFERDTVDQKKRDTPPICVLVGCR